MMDQKQHQIIDKFIDLVKTRAGRDEVSDEEIRQIITLLHKEQTFLVPDQIYAAFMLNMNTTYFDSITSKRIMTVEPMFTSIVIKRVTYIIQAFLKMNDINYLINFLKQILNDFPYHIKTMQQIYKTPIVEEERILYLIEHARLKISELENRKIITCYDLYGMIAAESYPFFGLFILFTVPKIMFLSDSLRNELSAQTPWNILTDYDSLYGRDFFIYDEYKDALRYSVSKYSSIYASVVITPNCIFDMISDCKEGTDMSHLKMVRPMIQEKAYIETKDDDVEYINKSLDRVFETVDDESDTSIIKLLTEPQSWKKFELSCGSHLLDTISNRKKFMIFEVDIEAWTVFSFQQYIRNKVMGFYNSCEMNNGESSSMDKYCIMVSDASMRHRDEKNNIFKLGSETISNDAKIISGYYFNPLLGFSLQYATSFALGDKDMDVSIIFIYVNLNDDCNEDTCCKYLKAIIREAISMENKCGCSVVVLVTSNVISCIQSNLQ